MTKALKEEGLQVACAEYLSGDVYDVHEAIAQFKEDPPEGPFQEGYLAGLMIIRMNLRQRGWK